MTPYCKHHMYIVFKGKAAMKCEPRNCKHLTWIHSEPIKQSTKKGYNNASR